MLVRTGKARAPKPHHKQIAETKEKSPLKISHPVLNQTICASSKPGNPSFINPNLKPRILHTIFVTQINPPGCKGGLLHVNSFIPPPAASQLQPHLTQPDAVRDRLEKSCCSTRAPVLSNARSIPPSSLFAGSKQPIILATVRHRQLWAGVTAAKEHPLSDLKDPGCPGGAISHPLLGFSTSNRKLSLKRRRKKVCQAQDLGLCRK